MLMLAGFTVLSSNLWAQAPEEDTEESSKICNKPFTQIYEEISPAVVFISVTRIDPLNLRQRVKRSLGSGFIIHEKGLILTNSHVVDEAQVIKVTLDDGQKFKAKIIGNDPIYDIALIQILGKPKNVLPIIPPGNSSNLKVGEEVVAIGNPLGLDQTLTTGVISALNRRLPESALSIDQPLIQTDAAINPGNSGGPLLNRCGEVIGINSAVLAAAQNIGFAIPINLVQKHLESLIEKGRIIRPWVGFHGQLIKNDVALLLDIPMVPGLLVEAVEPGSPADKAGIKGGSLDIEIAGDEYLIGGDIVARINDTLIDSPASLIKVMTNLKVGEKIKLHVYKDGKYRKVVYRLIERPQLPSDVRD